MKGYIYKITSPSNRIYIGKTTNLKKRIIYYSNSHCKAQKILYESIKKYGWDNHILEVIKEVDNIENLNNLEIEFIEKYKTNIIKYPEFNGMNLSDGGEGNTGPKSDSWKSKMKEKWESTEYREKMNNIYQSPEWKEKCRIRQKGKKLPVETKQKMKDNWLNEEYKAKMSQKFKKPKPIRSEIHRLKLSKSNSKAILQLDKEGNFIKEWNSMTAVKKELNIPISNISKVCNNKIKSAGGYVWKFKNE